MKQPLVMLVVPLLALAGCSRHPPASGSSHEREIAGLEQHAADLPPGPEYQGPPVEADQAAQAPAASRSGRDGLVSPGFQSAATVARSSLDALSRATESEAAFDVALAAARAHVTSARSAVQSEHDRSAAIVLTALLARQKELTFLNLLLQKNSTLEKDPELESEVQACSNELRSWLEGSAADAEQLQRGHCLTAARSAVAVLGQ